MEVLYDQGITVTPVPEGSTWAQMRTPTFNRQGYSDDTLTTITQRVHQMVAEPSEPTVLVTNKHGEIMSKHDYRLSCYEDITVGDAHAAE